MEIIERTQEEFENWLELKGKTVRKGRGFSAIEEIDFEEVLDGKTFCTKGINVNFYKFNKRPVEGFNKGNEYNAVEVERMLNNKEIELADTFIAKKHHYEKSKLIAVIEGVM